jgi:hypothetical protein
LVDSLLLPDQLPESHMLTRENIQGSLPSGQIKRTRFGKTGHVSKQQSGALNSTILMPGGSPSTVVDPLHATAVRLSSRGTLDGVTPPMDKVIDLARKTVESNAVQATSSRSLEHAELNHRDTDSAKRLERGGQSSTIDVVAHANRPVSTTRAYGNEDGIALVTTVPEVVCGSPRETDGFFHVFYDKLNIENIKFTCVSSLNSLIFQAKN